jgi:hypothetical protein
MVLSSDKHYLFLRKDSEKPAYNVKVLDKFSVVTYKSQETSEVFHIFKIWPSFNCFNLQGISRDSLFRDNMPPNSQSSSEQNCIWTSSLATCPYLVAATPAIGDPHALLSLYYRPICHQKRPMHTFSKEGPE